MIEHPEPPADFNGRELLIVNSKAPYFEFTKRRTNHFTLGAPRDIDSMRLPENSACSIAPRMHGVPLSRPSANQLGVSTVSVRSLTAHPLARLTFSRSLRVVDFAASGGLARAGADARICTGPRHLAQRWSLAVWRHPVQADGIAYDCKHDPPRVAAAVFDRAADAIRAESLGPLVSPEQGYSEGFWIRTSSP